MDIVCFYIISYVIIKYITSVYRSYGTNAKCIVVVVVHIAVVRIHVINVVAVVSRGKPYNYATNLKLI